MRRPQVPPSPRSNRRRRGCPETARLLAVPEADAQQDRHAARHEVQAHQHVFGVLILLLCINSQLTVQPLPPPAPTEEDQRHRGRYQPRNRRRGSHQQVHNLFFLLAQLLNTVADPHAADLKRPQGRLARMVMPRIMGSLLDAGPQVDRGALLAVRHRPPPPPPLLTVQPLPPPAPTEEDQRHLQSGRGRYQQVIPRSSPSASPAEVPLPGVLGKSTAIASPASRGPVLACH